MPTGSKFSQIPHLKACWEREAKQKKKLKRTALNSTADGLALWLHGIVELRHLAAQFEGISGAEMLLIESDEPLREFGVSDILDTS